MNQNDKIVIKNIMEDVVDIKLNDLMEKAGCCMCECCRADVFTYALNNLPPRYVASKSGNVFAHFRVLETQNQVDILTVIISGIAMVKKNPRHDLDKNRESK